MSKLLTPSARLANLDQCLEAQVDHLDSLEEKVEWLLDHLHLRSAWDAFDNAVNSRVHGDAGASVDVCCDCGQALDEGDAHGSLGPDGVPIIVKPADGAKGAPKGARIIAIVPMPTVVHYIIHTGHKEYKVETLPAAR